ncbi:MAG TPA: hypothetical protein VGX76_19630 [Pirellulales bacterium]|nr:hypothetical protein [Pirellulales bacterium]
MKNAKPKVRSAAVAKTEDLPGATAARLLVEHGLASPFADLRHASYRALQGRADENEVCEALLERAKNSLRKGTADEVTCGMFGVLLTSELEGVRTTTGELLGEILQKLEGGRAILVHLADLLGLEADEAGVTALTRLSKLAVFERAFALRRAVARALIRNERPEAIDALVDILERTGGEVRADIARHLTAISGEPYALDAARWKSWWRENRGSVTRTAAPTAPTPAPLVAALDAAAPVRYYGLPIHAQRLVFVLDTSGSMSGLRLTAAKRELLQAVAALPQDVTFNVLVFNGGVMAWSDSLQPASPGNKELAAAFVLPQPALGATWSYDALAAAMAFDVEAIYFLTDGQPSGGTLSDPAAIVTALTVQNQDRLVTINTLGIGVGLAGSPFDIFLQSLAAVNHGQYRRVDQ